MSQENQGAKNGSVPPADQQVEGDGQVQDPGQVEQPSQESSEKEGQLQALLAEREKRQSAEAELEFYRNLQNQQPSQEPEYDPDDLTSFANVNELVDKRVKQVEESFRQQQIIQMETRAREQYSDFDDVLSFAEEIAKKNPGMADAIMKSDNPAELAYQLGKSHPSYLKNQVQKSTNNIADKINNNLNMPPTLGNVSSQGSGEGAIDWGNATSEEVEAELQKIYSQG